MTSEGTADLAINCFQKSFKTSRERSNRHSSIQMRFRLFSKKFARSSVMYQFSTLAADSWNLVLHYTHVSRVPDNFQGLPEMPIRLWLTFCFGSLSQRSLPKIEAPVRTDNLSWGWLIGQSCNCQNSSHVLLQVQFPIILQNRLFPAIFPSLSLSTYFHKIFYRRFDSRPSVCKSQTPGPSPPLSIPVLEDTSKIFFAVLIRAPWGGGSNIV